MGIFYPELAKMKGFQNQLTRVVVLNDADSKKRMEKRSKVYQTQKTKNFNSLKTQKTP